MRTMVIMMNMNEARLQRIRELVPDWNVICGKDRSNWESSLAEAEVAVGWRQELADTLRSGSSKLKWVQNWGAGVDHMPLALLHDKGIAVTNASGVHPNPISETIVALMLALTRNIHKYVRNQMQRKWDHAGLRLEMHGKTVGIVGLGAIGTETAKIAKAFGMKVLGIRRSGKDGEYTDAVYGPERLMEVLPQCDYVVVTVPLTDETRHMFGKRQFEAMKSSAFFINIGRGATADTNALVEALTNGSIAGAGLDVFEQEPLPDDHPLWGLENVIVTPHTSGSTEHYDERALDIFLTNLESYVKGKPLPLNRVTPDKNY